jgi:hypothetical protein
MVLPILEAKALNRDICGRIRALLREMVSEGIIKKIGDKRYAYYVLKP